MRLMLAALLFQALTAPDPAQMEKAPDLGFRPVEHGLKIPDGVTMGAPSAVAVTASGHVIVFNRGPFPLLEFDKDGTFVRSMGEGRYVRPHGMRLDSQGNIWTTDVNGHTVTKMSPQGDVLLTLGVRGQAGQWSETANSRLLNEPTDLAFGPAGEIYLLQGHGRAEERLLKFDRTGTLVKSWGGRGKAPGQFDTSHSIVVDARGLIYVADRQNRRVQIFDGEGNVVREWKFAGLPCGLYIGADRQMYLVTGYSGQILKLDADGKALAATGQPGKGLGEFGEAHYMTIGAGGEIWVADTVKPALHKFVRR
jgi:DNA-binding beta-propeller fold protein YncE